MITASIVSYHHRLNELKKVIDCVLAEQVDKLYIVDNSSDDRLRELEGTSDRIRNQSTLQCRGNGRQEGYGSHKPETSQTCRNPQ